MTTYHLEHFFRPNGIAVVGAGEAPDSIGGAILRNLREGGYPGRIVPINPKRTRIGGLKVLPSVEAIADPIDLAVIATPIRTVPGIIAMCARVGIGAAIVISAGGREVGDSGRDIEAEIKAQADAHGIRIIGPNCLGIMVPGRHLNTSFAAAMPLGGKIAFVSQSGAMCTAILDLAFQERIGFSHFVSIGSMLDVDIGDLIDYLGNQAGVDSILLYIESLTHVRKFMSAARSVSRAKPIIALKAGRSAAGARAAASHTGALAGEDAVYDAAFRRAGIIRVDSIQDLFDCAELIAKQPLPRGGRLGIISNGGGPAVMAADAISGHGSDPEPLRTDTRERLDALLPPFWNRSNPIDILGDATAQRYADVIQICLDTKNFDGLLVMFVPQAIARPDAVAEALLALKRTRSLPIIACWMGGRDVGSAVQRMNLAGIPTYDTPERAVRAFNYLVRYVHDLELLMEVPPRLSRQLEFRQAPARRLIEENLPGGAFLTETRSKELLDAYGIAVTKTWMASDIDTARRLTAAVGFPLAMKIVSPDIPHKTEVNGIRLDIRNEDEAGRAFEEILASAKHLRPDARIDGVALQPFIERADYELLLGAKRDEKFGPVIVFGLGGIFTEVVKDRSIGLPPLNRLLAKRLMQATKAFKLLSGYRHRPPADMESLEEMLIRLSQLLIDFPEIQEADLNPVVVKDGRPIAVDARVLLSPAPAPTPLHLVISPYPGQLEATSKTKDGVNFLIRPIRPEDGPLFIALFDNLSAASIYTRFCRCVKSIEPAMLARFTQIDYDREMALVAIEGEPGKEKMWGVARIINEIDGKSAEFAIMIGDPWQGQGIGARLLEKLVGIGRERGLDRVWGYVLRENTHMLRLGKKIGFTVKYSDEVEMYLLTLEFPKGDNP